MKINILVLLPIILLLSDNILGQSPVQNSEIQDSLSKLSTLIWKQTSDSGRLQANDIFFVKFRSVLESEKSSTYSLDSIVGITQLVSADKSLHIFTWNVPMKDGTNKYFGFIQLRLDTLRVIPLLSTESNVTDLDTKQLTPQTWYGAIYYKMIEVEINGRKAYTLLGWDGYTANSNRKFIDIIAPVKNSEILIGMPVFKTDKGLKTRIVLEYAKKANMLLHYDLQAILVKKKQKIKKENAWIIVMDRMVPMDPSMKGFRKYYVPSGDTYDGYIFKGGYWTLVENIDVVNKSVPVK